MSLTKVTAYRIYVWCGLLITAVGPLAACQEAPSPTPGPMGRIEVHDARFHELVATDAVVEIVADSFRWSEGPVWVGGYEGFILFSDVPANVIYKWSAGEGLSEWLAPSGYTGDTPRQASNGSNGLTLDSQGQLVLAQHGDRRVARMNAPLSEPTPTFETIADRWNGMRFNSPNDLAFDASGNLYVTDPPYGLPGGGASSEREIPFSGVYKVDPAGEVTLISDALAFPNGVALSPDDSRLYVTNSEPGRKLLVYFQRLADGNFGDMSVMADMSNFPGDNNPDGLKVDASGNIFTTGPEGVYVYAPDATLLGTIHTDVRTANCAWGDDGSTLYIAGHMFLLRVRTSTRGDRFGAG